MAETPHNTPRSASSRAAKSVDALSEKGRRTRSRLIDAARQVFERIGFVDARVADIVAEAGAAHGTFYTYFAAKDDIFLAVIEAQQEEIESAAREIDDRHSRTTREAIEASNRAYIEGYAKHSRLMASWVEATVMHKELRDLLEELTLFNIERTERALRRMRESGEIPETVDPWYAARALNSMMTHYSIRLFKDGPEGIDIDTAVRTATELWCQGIGLRTSPEST